MQDNGENYEVALKKQIVILERKHFQETAKMLEVFKEQFGSSAIEAAERFAIERSYKEGIELAKSRGSNTIQDIIQGLWEPAIPLGRKCIGKSTRFHWL